MLILNIYLLKCEPIFLVYDLLRLYFLFILMDMPKKRKNLNKYKTEVSV